MRWGGTGSFFKVGRSRPAVSLGVALPGVGVGRAHPVRDGRQTTEPVERRLADDEEERGAEAAQCEHSDAVQAEPQQREREERQLRDQEGDHHEIDGRRMDVLVDPRRRVREKNVVPVHKVLQQHVHQACERNHRLDQIAFQIKTAPEVTRFILPPPTSLKGEFFTLKRVLLG